MMNECASTRFYDDTQDVAYTCENAQHFFLHHVQYRWEDFHRKLKIAGKKGENIHKAHSGTQGDLSKAISLTCPSLRVVECCLPSGPGQNRPSKQKAPSGWRRHRGGQSTTISASTSRECKYIIYNDTIYACVCILYSIDLIYSTCLNSNKWNAFLGPSETVCLTETHWSNLFRLLRQVLTRQILRQGHLAGVKHSHVIYQCMTGSYHSCIILRYIEYYIVSISMHLFK